MAAVLIIQIRKSGFRNPDYNGVMTRLGTADSEVLRRSKVLFGNQHMLAVAGFIAEVPGTFTLSDVCTSTGVAQTTGYRLVGVLSQADLVSRLPRSGGERLQWYSRREHTFWVAATALIAEASRRTMSRQSPEPVRGEIGASR
jgi:hypothetical protein